MYEIPDPVQRYMDQLDREAERDEQEARDAERIVCYPGWVHPDWRGPYDYVQGFELYSNGKPLSDCRNADQRYGWNAARGTTGAENMTAAQLDRLGI